MIEPILVPAIKSMGKLFSMRTFRTPIWAIPRAAPPESARPILGRNDFNLSSLIRYTQYYRSVAPMLMLAHHRTKVKHCYKILEMRCIVMNIRFIASLILKLITISILFLNVSARADVDVDKLID